MIDLLMAELKLHGILLKTDPNLPNVCALIAGEPIRGSWWAHPKSHQIFHALTELAAHRDVLLAKLVSGKDTFIHRSLWPAFLAVALSREPWQFKSLDSTAKALLKTVDETGEIKASGAAATSLEKSLLVHGEQMHTTSGAHAKMLRSWDAWMQTVKIDTPDIPPSEARKQLEDVAARLNSTYEGHGTLPWRRSQKADRPFGR